MFIFILFSFGSVFIKYSEAACAAGSYIDPADSVCKVCPIGMYNPTVDATSCTACTSPRTTASTGSTAATQCYCPAGYFIDPADSVCKACSVGTYNPTTDATTCAACTAPMTTASAGSSAVTQCLCGPGNYLDPADSTCKVCAAGTYNAENNAASCASCPSAMTTATTGATAYTDCACKPGYQTQGSWCEMCPTGFYSLTGKETTCTQCPAGYTTLLPGSSTATACAVCNAGYYHDTTTNTCIVCAKGSYTDTTDKASCTPCPSGQTTSGTGSSEEWACHQVCPAGQFFSFIGTHGECSLCAVGTYAPAGSDAACTKCPTGYTTVAMGSSSSTMCTECEWGYLQNAGKCEPCPVGQYYTSFFDGTRAWNGKCVTCPTGKTTKTTGATSPNDCVCAPGTYVLTPTSWYEARCLTCPVGSYSDVAGAESCTNCPVWKTTTAVSQASTAACVCQAGTFLHATDNVCVKCRVGSYSADGATSCSACAAGSTTIAEGSLSVEDCVASVGYFLNPNTNAVQLCPSNSYTDKTGQTICIDCPVGKTNTADHSGCV